MPESDGINHLILDTFFKNGDITEHLLYLCQFEICFTCCEMLTVREVKARCSFVKHGFVKDVRPRHP